MRMRVKKHVCVQKHIPSVKKTSARMALVGFVCVDSVGISGL